MTFELPMDLDVAIRAILPKYLEIRRCEQVRLRSALKAGDTRALEEMGHRIKGTGSSYGLPAMTDLGRELQHAAGQGDLALCAEHVEAMDRLLDQVAAALDREALDREARERGDRA